MAALAVTDAFSNRQAHLAEAINVLGTSLHKRAVFEAVYKGKKTRKSVDEISAATGLHRKQILDAGKPLSRGGLFRQVGTNPVIYEKIEAITHIRNRILAGAIGQRRPSTAQNVRRTPRPTAKAPLEKVKVHDVFISHASEDKASFVRELASKLREAGISVWYDNYSLKWGDRLRRSVDHGLATSRFGIVVLSHAFVSKKWPKEELEGLFQRELAGKARILPVWHNISEAEVAEFSPMLAGRLAVQSSEPIDEIIKKLRELL